MIVRRRSFRAVEYDTVVARLRRTASTGLSSPGRLSSSDARGRVLIVRERVSLSDSEPDCDEIGAAGASAGGSSANAEL